jgi:hypothetical protein
MFQCPQHPVCCGAFRCVGARLAPWQVQRMLALAPACDTLVGCFGCMVTLGFTAVGRLMLQQFRVAPEPVLRLDSWLGSE